MPTIFRVSLIALTATLAACAGAPSQRAAPPPAAHSAASPVDVLYARLDADSRRYAAAIAIPPAPLPPPPPPVASHKSPKMKTYVVRKGDTLAAIARKSRCGTNAQDIAAANGLKGSHYAVKPGQTLRIPDC